MCEVINQKQEVHSRVNGFSVEGALHYSSFQCQNEYNLTSLTLSLQLVKHPSILEGSLARLGRLFLELLDGPLVDTSALVDQVTSGGGLAGVDVANDDDVDMSLFLAHGSS